MEKSQKAHDLKETIDMLRGRMDRLQESLAEGTDDYHRLFVYFVADQFENLSPNKVKICDSQGEQGIDFYNSEEDRFATYQCKLPELDLIEEKQSVPKFDVSPVNEIEDTLTFLTDSAGTAKGNKAAQEARNRYRANKANAETAGANYQLEVVATLFGRLTTPAKDKLEELKRAWAEGNESFKITIYDFDDIASELSLSSLISRDRPQKIELDFRKDTDVHTDEWGYGLIPAVRFYELFDEYGMALFDLNVRYYLERSSVNRSIVNTLKEVKGQKRFHLLNNGVTISCENWKFPGGTTVRLQNPQIINGCQTVISIFRAYTQMDDEYKQRSLKEHCFVPVRIIRNKDRTLLDLVVTASNNQNKMTPRNLLSNTRTQLTLQKRFDQLKDRWFYERKDAEFESMKQYPTREFKPKHYQYKNRFRLVNNEVIAKSWLSFIGFSKDASENINAFELDVDGGRYEWLFERRPNANHWMNLTLGPQVAFSEDDFEATPPSPEQYLLSFLIYEFVRAFLPSPQSNKKECEQRLRKSKKVNDNSSHEEINKAMIEDDHYVLYQILNNMKEVIVELFAWILVKTYGPIDENTARKILALEGFADLYSGPDFKSYAKSLRESNPEDKLNNPLFTSLEFIKDAVMRWKVFYGREYLASQRRIRFLHAQATVEHLKNYLHETNNDTRQPAYEWKPPKVSFLESLPKLNP